VNGPRSEVSAVASSDLTQGDDSVSELRYSDASLRSN
jgi:hypothetical protein